MYNMNKKEIDHIGKLEQLRNDSYDNGFNDLAENMQEQIVKFINENHYSDYERLALFKRIEKSYNKHIIN
tara:strand:- start:414 stop:623 length:210 start_codon:yes stop_codon:yes gene_type:complete